MATVVDHDYSGTPAALASYTEDSIGYVEVFNDAVGAVATVHADTNVRTTASEDSVGYIYRVDQATADANYSVQISSQINAGHVARPNIIFGRLADADNWYAAGRYRAGDNPDVVLYKKTTAGGLVQLGTSDAGGTDTGGLLKLEMIGTAIKVYFAGLEVISVSDSDIAAQGFAGLGHGNILVSADQMRAGERIDDLLVVDEGAPSSKGFRPALFHHAQRRSTLLRM